MLIPCEFRNFSRAFENGIVTYILSAVTYMIPLVVTYIRRKNMKISTAAKEYFTEIEIRKFTPKTIRSYRNNLNLFCVFARNRPK